MDTERYSRQIAFPGIGFAGQEKLLRSSVTIIGLGALGSVIAEELARAGVGNLRLADRDYVERSNLARQAMYTEKDADEQLPKAIAAANHIAEINPDVATEPIIADVNASNIESLVIGADVVLDGSDNFELRALINEACVKHGIPWIYGGAIAADGAVMPILPGKGPCFHCITPTVPTPGAYPTCATAGIINMTSHTIASIEAAEAIKIIVGNPGDEAGKGASKYLSIDLWNNDFDVTDIERNSDCPVCGKGIYALLEKGIEEDMLLPLCTAGSFQIMPDTQGEIDLNALAERLSAIGRVLHNPYLLRFDGEGVSFNLFRDGRAVIRNARDAADARSIYAEYIG
ncbi:MAG: ThiF family adenylyltransferase [Clostridiales Family XIII bacterium]|jgi:adenylyltransferase/sulfurtransferase|nr:ThiF family adenylyltransferase [Clostridiales Family XIII bacterium]